MEIACNENFKLEYDAENERLTQVWTGFATSDSFREAIDMTVEFIQTHRVKTLLADTASQKVVQFDDSEYAASKMPVIFGCGVKAMAFVLPRNIFTQMSLKSFAEANKGSAINYFTTPEDAVSWLNKF